MGEVIAMVFEGRSVGPSEAALSTIARNTSEMVNVLRLINESIDGLANRIEGIIQTIEDKQKKARKH